MTPKAISPVANVANVNTILNLVPTVAVVVANGYSANSALNSTANSSGAHGANWLMTFSERNLKLPPGEIPKPYSPCGTKIISFSGYYDFLSNFYIEPDGSCVEKEFQASKTTVREEQLAIFNAPTPGAAKRLGRHCTLRKDWEEVKLRLMWDFVAAKFQDFPRLASKLRLSDPMELVEGNNWGDTYWGVCRGVGRNYLGKILMDIREQLISELSQ